MSRTLKVTAIVIVLVMQMSLTAFTAHLYTLCHQQKIQLDLNDDQFGGQQQAVTGLRQAVAGLGKELQYLNQQFKEYKDILAAQKEQRGRIENDIQNIKNSIVSTRTYLGVVKQEVKEWQKDYIVALVEIKKRAETSEEQIKDFYEELNSKIVPNINKEINSLKSTVDKIIHPPYAASTAQSTPTSDGKLLKDLPF